MEHLLHRRLLLHFLVYFFLFRVLFTMAALCGIFLLFIREICTAPSCGATAPAPQPTVYNVCNRQSIFIPVQDIE